jgi:hypothetical protein
MRSKAAHPPGQSSEAVAGSAVWPTGEAGAERVPIGGQRWRGVGRNLEHRRIGGDRLVDRFRHSDQFIAIGADLVPLGRALDAKSRIERRWAAQRHLDAVSRNLLCDNAARVSAIRAARTAIESRR